MNIFQQFFPRHYIIHRLQQYVCLSGAQIIRRNARIYQNVFGKKILADQQPVLTRPNRHVQDLENAYGTQPAGRKYVQTIKQNKIAIIFPDRIIVVNGSCSTFTKCSDYTPGTRGCQFKSGSAQKCQNNFAGTACENVPTSTCSDFTTDMDCYNSSIGLCHFDTTCKHITNCSQFMSSTSCTDSHMCIYDTACREMSCSDYPKDNCHNIFELAIRPHIINQRRNGYRISLQMG